MRDYKLHQHNSDWTDTAKQLAAHPKWEWRPAMASKRDGNDFIYRIERDDDWFLLRQRGHFPDLTDWATVGIILGMCVEAFAAARTWEQRARAIELLGRWLKSLLEAAIMDRDPVVPGQALAELLLELWEKGN